MQGGPPMPGPPHMSQQMGQPPMIPNQPQMHGGQPPGMMSMSGGPGPSPYSTDGSFNQSPAPSQPQVPTMVSEFISTN